MYTKTEASFLVMFNRDNDPYEGAWKDFNRYGRSGPLVRPYRLKVKIRLVKGEEGWHINDVSSDITHVNVKKNGETGERVVADYLYGQKAEAYSPLVEKAVKAAKMQFHIEEDQ